MFDDFVMNHWAWAGLAMILAMLELIAPGVFFLWLAISALATALLAFFAPNMGWEWHLLVFSILSIVVTWTGKRYVRQKEIKSEDETLNRRGNRMVGQVLVLTDAITNGSGRVKVGDSGWLARGPDLPKGARVRVVSIDGAALIVEAAD